MKAIWNGAALAESEETIVVEGNRYFPPEAVNFDCLERTGLRTLCPWKGIASYYSAEVEGDVLPDAAWTYRRPLPWIRKIRDHVAFSEEVDVHP